MADSPIRSDLRLAGITVVLGVASGGAAILLTWILHSIEEVVYGRGEQHGQVLVDGISNWRMAAGVAVVSVVLAVAWWALRRRSELVGVRGMVDGKPAPIAGTLLNAVLQMIGVGAGLPVGREAAPRELAGLIAGRLSREFDEDTRRLLVAASAGAGLGAVYQVPVAGAVFAVELLLHQVSARIVAVCLGISAIATLVSRASISPLPQYKAVHLDGTTPWLWLWALAVGALLGPLGGWFGDVADRVKARSQRGAWTLLTLSLTGLAVAATAWFLPLVLGNGRAAAQSAFLGMGLGAATIVLVGKLLATFLTLRAGAVGGTLAPGIAAGALGGIIIGHLAAAVMPGVDVPVTALAVLGAAALLATSLRGPVTGLLLVAGVTGQGHEALLVMTLAVVAAFATSMLRRPIPA